MLDTLHAVNEKSDSLIDSDTKTRLWLETELHPKSGDEIIDAGYDFSHPAGQPAWNDDARSQSGDARTLSEGPISLTVAGRRFVFGTEIEVKRAAVNSAAYQAASRGDNEALDNLLSRGADVNALTGLYGTPLAAACGNGHRRSAELLLNAGADVNGGGSFGTPLELASENGHLDIVEMLLTIFERKNAYGGHEPPGKLFTGTALHDACRRGHEAVVRLLLDRGADVDLTRPTTQETALHEACMFGRIGIVNMLLDSNADVHAQGSEGTALRTACRNDHYDVSKLLLEHGTVVADVLPLGVLKLEIISLLVDAGADVDSLPATQPGRDTASHVGNGKFWARIVARQRKMKKKAKTELERERKWMHTPFKEPRMLRSCGCLICDVDQKAQPAIPRYKLERVSLMDPISYTLSLMKIHSADS